VNAGDIQLALVQRIGWRQNRMMPEFFLDGGQCDLLQVTRSGYATEYEIKVSKSDWDKDATKDKWRRPRPHISRFFYAVPEPLADYWPEWAPGGAGLIAVRFTRDLWPVLREVRPARRLRATKLNDVTLQRMWEAAYWRYWNYAVARGRERQKARRDRLAPALKRDPPALPESTPTREELTA
jgi:hypothetical protein